MEKENINELNKCASEAFAKGEYLIALQYYYRLLAIDTSSSAGHYNVGVVCGILGDIELAVAFYKKAIRLDETNVRAINNLAGIYIYNLQDFDTAIKYLDYTIKIAPNDAEAYNAYGNIYLFKEDFKKAELYFKKAIFLDENYFKNHYDMARACACLKQKTKAKKALKRCIELAPNYQPAIDLQNNI